MSEFKQNQHQIQQSGEQVQDAQLSQAELVAALLLKLFNRQERQPSLKTTVGRGKETKETVEIAVGSQVAARPPEGIEPTLNLSLDSDDNSQPSGLPLPSESKPSLNHFANSVHRQNDLRALASRPTQQRREQERSGRQEAKETQSSDLER